MHKTHKNPRIHGYNYKDGWFFLTTKTNYSQPYLKDKLYDLVKEELFSLPEKYLGVKVDFFSLMPTHLHTILILDEVELPLSEIWRRFKAVTTFEARKVGFENETLWQKGFYEHIVRSDKALERIRKYIYNNPLKMDLPLDEIYSSPEEFRLIIH